MGFPDHPAGQDRPSYGQQGYQGHPATGPATNNMAVAALACGLAQFLLWFLLLVPGFIAAVLALVFGIVSMNQIRQREEFGRPMAITGVILGGLGILGGVVLGILIGVGIAPYHSHLGY